MTRPCLPAAMLGLTLLACAPPPAAAPHAAAARFGADSAAVRELATGVRHHALRYAQGPWAVHLLEIAPRVCGVEFRAEKGGERLLGRKATSRLAAEAQEPLGRPVLGAVNADFFTFQPDGVPLGPQVTGGEALKDAGGLAGTGADGRRSRQPAFGVSESGAPLLLEHAALSGALRAGSGATAPLGGVNTGARGDSLLLLTWRVGEATPADSGLVEVLVRVARAATVGDTARGVVVGLDTLPAGVPLGPDRVVFAARAGGAAWLRRQLAPGDSVAWWLAVPGVPGTARELVGGFPTLLRDGEAVFATTPGLNASFSQTRHPRTAVGLRPDGTVLLVTVDGRQPGYSEGMSLAELTELMRRLGARDALNLDGGGSTALVALGEVVNRPSDREGERPVANALLVLGPRPGQCPGAARR